MTRVLVPVRILEGESVSQGIVDLLSDSHVVLLGYHRVPDQTAPGQARMSFEDRAQATLADLATAFEEAGATVDTRLVFTHDPGQTLRRVAREADTPALVHLGVVMAVEDVLVVLHGDIDPERIGTVAAPLLAGRDASVTLLEVGDEDAESGMGEVVASRLVDGGVDEDHISVRRSERSAAVETIVEAAAMADVVFLGEREPSFEHLVSNAVFGDFEQRVADESLTAVVEVLAEQEADDEGDEGGSDEDGGAENEQDGEAGNEKDGENVGNGDGESSDGAGESDDDEAAGED